MKKCFSLLAILGLLSICLVSSLYAAAPVVADFPDLKLFQGAGISGAFDLTASNTGPDAADTSAITVNFAGLNSITGGSSNTLAGTVTTFNVNQGSFGSATVGAFTYLLGNAGGTVTAVSKAKWATFKINKLPKIGLNIGDTYSLNLITGGYVSPSLPASFGQAAAIVSSDPTKVTAAWANASTITISMISAAASPVNVDVIAAPSASAPFGTNIDKERIVVAQNLLPNSTFATAADTAAWGYELSVGKATLVTPGQSASVLDGAGTSASGVATFAFADANGGVKATPFAASRVVMSAGQWYTARARVFSPDAGNTHQFQLFIFSNDLLAAQHVDVAANVYFGVPTTWTWVEQPMLCYGTGTGFPQYQWKAGAAGTGNIDEIQVINSSPVLADVPGRSAPGIRYVYGDFNAATDTTGWGDQGYAITGGETVRPTITVGTSLHLDFSGAGAGSAQKGLKWTANNGVGGSIYTPVTNPGSQIGVKVNFGKASGNINSVNGILLLSVYEVSSNGGADFFSAGGQLIASAEFGGVVAGIPQSISNGTHYAIGAGRRGFTQFQFAIKNDQAAVADIDNADLITDSLDNPNFGDATLYP